MKIPAKKDDYDWENFSGMYSQTDRLFGGNRLANAKYAGKLLKLDRKELITIPFDYWFEMIFQRKDLTPLNERISDLIKLREIQEKTDMAILRIREATLHATNLIDRSNKAEYEEGGNILHHHLHSLTPLKTFLDYDEILNEVEVALENHISKTYLSRCFGKIFTKEKFLELRGEKNG